MIFDVAYSVPRDQIAAACFISSANLYAGTMAGLPMHPAWLGSNITKATIACVNLIYGIVLIRRPDQGSCSIGRLRWCRREREIGIALGMVSGEAAMIGLRESIMFWRFLFLVLVGACDKFDISATRTIVPPVFTERTP